MSTRMIGIGVVLAGLCVAVTGCRKGAEKLSEKLMEKAIEHQSGGKADVDIQGDSVKIVTKDGEASATFGDKASVPKDFPSDVTIYKGAKVVGSVSTPDGAMVNLQSKDAAGKIIEFYQAEMAKNGWEQENTADMGAQKMLSMKKGERQFVVMVTAADDMSQIMLTVPKAKKAEKTE